jgi:hypothetical protein
MSMLSVLRQVIAISAFVITLLVGINLVIAHGSRHPEAIGFTLLFTIIVAPFAFIALALDCRYLQTKRDSGTGVDSASRMRLLAPIAFAVMAIAPFVAWHLHLILANSWWLIFSPMWIALLVHRAIMSATGNWFLARWPRSR